MHKLTTGNNVFIIWVIV